MADQDAEHAEHTKHDDRVHLPAPTAWPLVVGFAVTLIFAGIVTHPFVSVVGAVLAVFGAVGFWRDVLPIEKVEYFEVRAPAAEAAPPEPPPALQPGRNKHRMRLPVEIHPYSSGVRGGLAGAVTMAVVAMAWGWLYHRSVWFPINLLAAMPIPGLTETNIEYLKGFHWIGIGLAVFIHAVASVIVGLLYAVILPMFPSRPLLLGGIVTPILWSALLWSSMRILNPLLDDHINWIWFVASQFVYGLTVGFVIARSERIETIQSASLTERAGLEMSRGGKQ